MGRRGNIAWLGFLLSLAVALPLTSAYPSGAMDGPRKGESPTTGRPRSRSYPADAAKGPRMTLTGKIYLFGSDPMVWVGFMPDDRNAVYRVTPRPAAGDLALTQGEKVRVTFILLDSDGINPVGFGDASIRVLSWKIVK